MPQTINTQPDLTVTSATITTRIWTLGKRVTLPAHFASPDLCVVSFPGEPPIWKIAQLTLPDREVDLTFTCLNMSKVTASFYNANGELRAPTPDEERAVSEIERAVSAIMHRFGSNHALA